jgi:hypothetical protein
VHSRPPFGLPSLFSLWKIKRLPSLFSLWKIKRLGFNLTKGEKEAFSLSSELADIIVGLVLGDLNIQKDKRAVNGNARLRFVLFSILYGKNTQFLMGQST